MVTSEQEFSQQQQEQQGHHRDQDFGGKSNDEDKLKTLLTSPSPADASDSDVCIKTTSQSNGTARTSHDKGGSDVRQQALTFRHPKASSSCSPNGEEYLEAGSQYYYYYYPPEQDQFCYQGGSSSSAPPYSMVAYPFAYETACHGENEVGDEELAIEEVDQALAGVENGAGPGPGMTGGAVPLPTAHNDLFINPAFSYLQFLSDGSVVGPNGELYTPADYYPGHAAATAPVDVSPLQLAEMPSTGLVLPCNDFPGKISLLINLRTKCRGVMSCRARICYDEKI